MTREEIINALQSDKMMPYIQPEQLANIVDFVSENCKPSLPEGLEEAAEEQARSFGYMSEDYEYKENVESFKAGAKWMAEQGVSVEKIVGQLEHSIAGHPSFLHGFEVSELDAPFFNSKEVGYGDKVIVQIRKK